MEEYRRSESGESFLEQINKWLEELSRSSCTCGNGQRMFHVGTLRDWSSREITNKKRGEGRNWQETGKEGVD